MTGTERVLAELKTGPKTAAELYASTFSVVHSRISDLRRAGYDIGIERLGGTGAASFLYRLKSSPAASPPVTATVPEATQLTLIPGPGTYDREAA